MAAVNGDNDSTTATNITNMLESVTLTETPPKPLSSSEEVFPPEIIFDILVRLPVKSLQRFRAACKPWNAMISSDRKFAKEQLRRATASATAARDCNHLLTYVHSYPDDEVQTSYLSDYPVSYAASSPDAAVGTYSQPNGPLVEGDWLHFEGDSCRGLILMNVDMFEDALVVWNPSTGKYRALPAVKDHPIMGPCSVHTGFGYDSSTDTYKVVEVSHERKVDINIAMVHTVGRDSSWRVIPNFPAGSPRCCTKFVSGSLHWLLDRDYSVIIVSMDMGTETLEEVVVPEKIIGNLELAVFKDSLCIVGHRHRVMMCDVWVMKEYGNAESWTKLFSIPNYETNPRSRYPLYSIMDTVSDDEILLLNESSFVVYNHKTGFFRVPAVQGFYGQSDFRVYTESLVSP